MHDDALDKEIALKKSFGHIGDEHFSLGINGKNSEFHAAMGLANLPYIQGIIEERRKLIEDYDEALKGLPVTRPRIPEGLRYNYAYFPVLFSNEPVCLAVIEALKAHDIMPRRYFWPSLDRLPYVAADRCEESLDISSRVLCLPLYNGMSLSISNRIVEVIGNVLNNS